MVLVWALVGAAVAFCYASLFEWAVHRFLYHPPYRLPIMARPHARHHDEIYPVRRYFEKGAWYRAVQPPWLETAYLVLHVPIFLLVATLSVGAAVGAFVGSVVYAILSHYVHPLIHMRTGAWYERTRLFACFLKRHIWHHYRIDTNYNIVLPLGDWLFGTGHHRVMRLRKAAAGMADPGRETPEATARRVEDAGHAPEPAAGAGSAPERSESSPT